MNSDRRFFRFRRLYRISPHHLNEIDVAAPLDNMRNVGMTNYVPSNSFQRVYDREFLLLEFLQQNLS